MADEWGRGTTAVLTAYFREGGTGALVNAAPVLVDILDPDDTVIVNNATPTNPSTGTYTYSYDIDEAADLGVWTARWTGVINGVPVTGEDPFEVVDAGDVSFDAGEAYATVAELKTRMSITNATHDTELEHSLLAASRGVDGYCGRTFVKDTTATARVFRALGDGLVLTDDFHTTSGLIVKTDTVADGTFANTVTSTTYSTDGSTGHPYSRIRTRGTSLFLPGETVQVTAQWGWAAVPSAVKEATLILAETLFKLKDAPFGVAGFDQWGSVRVRENPYVEMLLAPYKVGPVVG